MRMESHGAEEGWSVSLIRSVFKYLTLICLLVLAMVTAQGCTLSRSEQDPSAGLGANQPPCSAPASPTGPSVKAGNAQVSLSWAPISGAVSYNVKRSTTSGGPYTIIATGITATSYLDTSVTNGTTYYYVVSAVNSCGESGNSNQASATPCSAPASPTGLSATAGNAQV